MNPQETKRQIEQNLRAFATGDLRNSALTLLATLGYRSDKQLVLEPNTVDGFIDAFGLHATMNRERALVERWRRVEFLCQLTKDEISQHPQLSMFTTGRVDNTIIESYLFIAIELEPDHYTRTNLATITREVNKQFQMPVLILFLCNSSLTFSIINRRLHKRDESKDVLEKVTLIKDIDLAQTHRAHLEILFDLSLDQLYQQYDFRNFVELHRAWQKTLDSSELNKRFFQEIANWYFWAAQQVAFPVDAHPDPATRTALSLIRLLTRLIFVWFLKEKGLIPDALFNRTKMEQLLVYADAHDSTYYKAILQNLFFATLNQEMNTATNQENRKFRHEAKNGGRDHHFMVHNLYRYKRYFKDPDAALQLFADIPFLNGGLFECLDKADAQDPKRKLRVDGFSDRDDNPLRVPDSLFFDQSHAVDLNEVYGTQKRRYQVRGLIEILSSYKFTVTENTPIEEEVALDPELLGRVFENLLAAYNEETQTTARKQTGSFYTPREVVDYMVDEALLAYLEGRLRGQQKAEQDDEALTARLQHLLTYNDEPPQFNPREIEALIAAIDAIKILDPACGSGAFPMGVLQKLVFILGKLDPDNQLWKERQLAKLDDVVMQSELERIFRDNYSDYGRKLYLIENCIYGVDIQPIAVQIAKLRFFISLVVDQKINDRAENRGIRPLPNLETKFVAANSLLAIERPRQIGLIDADETILQARKELKAVRHRYFSARTQATKDKYRERDKALRAKLSDALQNSGFPQASAQLLTQWDPYNQNVSANFFDVEWMFTFSANEGFDLVIGNPPYVRQEKLQEMKPALQNLYDCYTGTADLYVYFFERGFQALKAGGVLSYISSNKYFRAGYGRKLRTYLRDKSTIRRLIDFGDAPVFTAIAYPSIIVLVKTKPKENYIQTLTWEAGAPVSEFPEIIANNSFILPQEKLTPESWRLEPTPVLRLLERLRRYGTPLGDYVKGRLYRGIVTGFNDAFVVDRTTRDRLIAEDPTSIELLKPFLRGRDVKRWTAEFQDLWLIFTRRGVDINQYPAIKNYLYQFKDRLMPGLKGGRKPGSYEWFEIQDNIAYWEEFEHPKIIFPSITQTANYALDFNNYYGNDKTSICISNNITYVSAILNSTLMLWFIKCIASTKQGGFYEFKPMYVTQIPIADATLQQRTALDVLVRYILYLKQHPEEQVNPHVPNEHIITLLEEAINGCVYELYFSQVVDAQKLNVIDLIRQHFLPISGEKVDATIREKIEAGYQALRTPESEIRNRLIKQKIMVDEIKLITAELAT